MTSKPRADQETGEKLQDRRVDVSIIIVSWNTRDILRDCLRSVYENAGDVWYEVVVVDNGSTDDSAEMVESEFPRARLIRNSENLGFAAANNQGMAVSRARYSLLLNSDTLIVDGAIASSVKFADAHPEAGLVGCRTIFGDGRLQYNCYMFPSVLNLALSMTRLNRRFRRNRFFGRYRLLWWDYASPRTVDAIAGCFMLARREAVEQVGPMDESYFMYSEDTDWCWRFLRHGWRTMYTPDGLIIHLKAASSSQAAANMNVFARRSLLMFLERKDGKLTKWMANSMFLCASFVRLIYLGMRRMVDRSDGEHIKLQLQTSAAAIRFHTLGRIPDCP